MKDQITEDRLQINHHAVNAILNMTQYDVSDLIITTQLSTRDFINIILKRSVPESPSTELKLIRLYAISLEELSRHP